MFFILNKYGCMLSMLMRILLSWMWLATVASQVSNNQQRYTTSNCPLTFTKMSYRIFKNQDRFFRILYMNFYIIIILFLNLYLIFFWCLKNHFLRFLKSFLWMKRNQNRASRYINTRITSTVVHIVKEK